jgi:formamidopyrimidine-DNA glycosylase
LGRIRLLPEPILEQKPISDLGFDPVQSHPTFDEFKELIGKKKGTVKGVIMDQAFSAGVGNVSDRIISCTWRADIIVGGR